MKREKPPPGVRPLSHWRELCPAPTLEDLVSRYVSVMDAVERYRAAGREPLAEWLDELGVRDTR